MNTQSHSLTRQQALPLVKTTGMGKVICLYPQVKQSTGVMDDKRSYLALHIALGIALGASLMMAAIALFTQSGLQRGLASLGSTIATYALVTTYYHVIKHKKKALFTRGATIVTLTSLVTIMVAAFL